MNSDLVRPQDGIGYIPQDVVKLSVRDGLHTRGKAPLTTALAKNGMGLFRGVPKWVRYAVVFGIVFPLVLVLFLVTNLSDIGGETAEGGAVRRKGAPSGNTRKPLDVGKREVDDLRFQV